MSLDYGELMVINGMTWAEMFDVAPMLKVDLTYNYEKFSLPADAEPDVDYPGTSMHLRGDVLNPDTEEFYDYDVVSLGSLGYRNSEEGIFYDAEGNRHTVESIGHNCSLIYALFKVTEVGVSQFQYTLVKATDIIDANDQFTWLPVLNYIDHQPEE